MVGGQLAQQEVNFTLCADVNASCRLVDDQNARANGQPLGDQRFLLVPAAQPSNFLIDGWCVDVQPADELLGDGALFAIADETVPGDLFQIGGDDITSHGHIEKQPGGFAVFRQVAESVANSVGRRVDLDSLPVD